MCCILNALIAKCDQANKTEIMQDEHINKYTPRHKL